MARRANFINEYGKANPDQRVREPPYYRNSVNCQKLNDSITEHITFYDKGLRLFLILK